jgi:hypothetical protein
VRFHRSRTIPSLARNRFVLAAEARCRITHIARPSIEVHERRYLAPGKSRSACAASTAAATNDRTLPALEEKLDLFARLPRLRCMLAEQRPEARLTRRRASSIEGVVKLTDKKGEPLCASVKPKNIAWRL